MLFVTASFVRPCVFFFWYHLISFPGWLVSWLTGWSHFPKLFLEPEEALFTDEQKASRQLPAAQQLKTVMIET